mgnify:CR=1 FL=1
MKYPVTQHHDYVVLQLTGEIDLSESPNARKQILNFIKNNNNLLVDLSLVEYIDSSGVASLVEGFQTSRAEQLKFALVGVSASAMQVLQLARLDSVFTIYTSLDDVKE